MSVIIRLQNLPWSANSYDIRQYFQGLSIPEGGVHIVGGELGDAFIAFSTDEDARQAMMRTGGKLKEVQVSLLLSSRTEMQRVIEAARSMTMPPVVQPVIQTQQQQPSLPQRPLQPASQQGQQQLNTDTNDSREPRKRTRSRSRDRSRSDRRDGGRRKRSRSRERRDDRRDDRDRGDRRRRRSRSRSQGRDRYGRDLEKRDTVSKDKLKDKNDRSRDKVVDVARKDSKDANPRQLGNVPTNPSIPPTAASNASDPFGILGNPDGPKLPFIDDRLTAAMKSTLSALNLPIPAALEKPIIPGLSGDPRRDIPQQAGQFGIQANKDVSRGHSGFPDPGPAFNDRTEPSSTFGGRPDLANPFGATNPYGARPEPPNMLGRLDPTNPFGTRSDGPNAFVNNFQAWGNMPGPQNPQNVAPNNMWPNTSVAPFMPMGHQNNAYSDGSRNELKPNQANMDTRGQGFPNQRNINGGNAAMDDDFRPRFVDFGGPFNQGSDAVQPDRTNLGRYGNDQNRFRPDDTRNPDLERNQFPSTRPNFDRPKFQDQSDNWKFNRDSDGRNDTRRDFNDHHRDGNERNSFSPNRRSYGEELNELFAEIADCPFVPYKEMRRAFHTFGSPVEEIKYINYDGNKKRRALLKFLNSKGKMKAVRSKRSIRIGHDYVTVIHMSVEEYHSALNDAPKNFEDRPRRFNDGEDRNWSRPRRSEENENKDFRPKLSDRNDGHNSMVWKSEDVKKKEEGKKNDNIEKKDAPHKETTGSSLPKQKESENDTKQTNLKTHCLFVSDLPLGTSDRDVFDFFSDIGITPKKLHLMLGSDGEPSGESYVEFWDEEEAKKALVKDGAPMGRACISVRLAKPEEMHEAVGLDGENVLESPRMPGPGPGPGHANTPLPLLPPRPFHPQHPQRGMRPNHMGPAPFHGRFPSPHPRFPQETRFRPNKNQGGPPARAPSPTRVLVLHNLPYRADVDEILEFMGPFGDKISVDDIFRRMNDRRQPTSEARVVLRTAEDAEMAKVSLSDKCIRDRPIFVEILANGNSFD